MDKRKRPVSDAGGRAKKKKKREEEVGGGLEEVEVAKNNLDQLVSAS
jgi:hypothetical protein